MSQVIIDSALLAKLKGLDQETAFVDEAGRTVGVFQPYDSYRLRFDDFTDAELDQRSKEPAEFTLDEIVGSFPRN